MAELYKRDKESISNGVNFVVIGTNHKFCPLEVREKLAFSKKRLAEAQSKIKNYAGIKKMVILSTCNRVELYANVKDIDYGFISLERFLSDFHQLESNEFSHFLYKYSDKQALRHLFEVSCGLDSQILGENQILEQVNFAYAQAKDQLATDMFIDDIFHKAIDVGFKVRNETQISEGDISIGSLSLELIKGNLATLKDKKLLIIGVGKISTLVVDHLRNEEVEAVFISNRTYKRALELASLINAKVLGFNNLKEKLKEVDVIISATASPHLILKKEDLLDCKKPLLIIDLAIPRDVDTKVKDIKGISLFCLDGFDFMIGKKLEERRKAVPKAKEIIEDEVSNLCWEKFIKREVAEVLLP